MQDAGMTAQVASFPNPQSAQVVSRLPLAGHWLTDPSGFQAHGEKQRRHTINSEPITYNLPNRVGTPLALLLVVHPTSGSSPKSFIKGTTNL
jgi:hypothetical protein